MLGGNLGSLLYGDVSVMFTMLPIPAYQCLGYWAFLSFVLVKVLLITNIILFSCTILLLTSYMYVLCVAAFVLFGLWASCFVSDYSLLALPKVG